MAGYKKEHSGIKKSGVKLGDSSEDKTFIKDGVMLRSKDGGVRVEDIRPEHEGIRANLLKQHIENEFQSERRRLEYYREDNPGFIDMGMTDKQIREAVFAQVRSPNGYLNFTDTSINGQYATPKNKRFMQLVIGLNATDLSEHPKINWDMEYGRGYTPLGTYKGNVSSILKPRVIEVTSRYSTEALSEFVSRELRQTPSNSSRDSLIRVITRDMVRRFTDSPIDPVAKSITRRRLGDATITLSNFVLSTQRRVHAYKGVRKQIKSYEGELRELRKELGPSE